MTLAEIALVFRVTEKTVRMWIDAGMPVKHLGKQGRGKVTNVDLESATRWYFDTNFERLELERERAGLAREQKERTAMENAVARGDLASITEIMKQVSDLIGAAKSMLLSIPTKEAPALVPLTDANAIESRLRKSICEALEQLTEYGSWTATRRRGDSVPGGSGVRATGHTNRKRVGSGA